MTFLLLVLLLETGLWLALVALQAVRLSPSGISDYELRRRVHAGDEQAKFLQRRDTALPDVVALRFAMQVLLKVVFVAVGFAVFGWVWLLAAVVALLFLDSATRLAVISQRAQHLYEVREPRLIAFTERWHKLLRWLRGAGGHVPGQFVYSKEELIERLKATPGVVSKDELALVQHGLRFSDKTVREVMTPRSVIDALEVGDALGPVALDHMHNSGHSRFPVYKHDIDHVVGLLYLRDLVPLKKSVRRASDAMHQEVLYIRDDHTLEHALAAFLRTHHHLLIVVNAYRETVGLLSLEDVLEALIGRKIIDEFDKHEDLRAVAARNPRSNNMPSRGKDV